MSDDLVAVGGRLTPRRLATAYASGLFPMRVGGLSGPLGWWSPDPRGILPLGGLVVSRSLRRSLRRYSVSVDTGFAEVIEACARRESPDEGWITDEFAAVYTELHRDGVAHCVAVHDGDGLLVGGLYGVGYGGLFAGESMFARAPDASKVALAALVALLHADGDRRRVLDVQWVTPHLAGLGAVAIPRADYLALLPAALAAPPPDWRLPEEWVAAVTSTR